MNEIIFRPSLKCEIAIDIKEESVYYKPEGPAKGGWTIFETTNKCFQQTHEQGLRKLLMTVSWDLLA